MLDSLRGLRETLQFGRTSERSAELDERMAAFSGVERRLKSRAARAMAATNGLVLALDVAMVMLAGALCGSGVVDAGQAFVAIAALMSSFGPVIAVANLGSTLQQTLASGARVLDLLDEQPQTKEVAWKALRGSSQEPNPEDITSNTQWSIVYDNINCTADFVLRRNWGEVFSFVV